MNASASQKTPGVSVIIPAFRRPELLAGAITSVLAQTYQDFELIIVDDDPDGSAAAVAEKFQDRRIIYLKHDHHRGGAAARNTGIARAAAGLIAFLDDDDLWHRDFLEKMTAAMSQCPNNVGVLHCCVELLDADGGRGISRPRAELRGDIHGALLRGEKPGGIMALVRREVFERCGGFDEKLPSAQDWDMWIRASRQFHFDHIADVLAMVRDHGPRISSDPACAIAARERILVKYAAEFDEDKAARSIHLKRLGKFHIEAGRWSEAGRWFIRAADGRPLEWIKIAAWLIFREQLYPVLAVIGSLAVAVYSQAAALRSVFVINDDVCQHLWWMRSFTDPALFPNDLLRIYAASLQNFGILFLYRATAWAVDPLVMAKILPFILFPAAVWALFRLVHAWTRDSYTALLCSVAFMVTPVYLQHAAGGHAHVFGYPLLLLFFYFLTARAYRAAAYVMMAATLFFPVVFALAGAIWLIHWLLCREQGKVLLVAAIAGLAVLAIKFMGTTPAVIGALLTRDEIMHMPELTTAGRWSVWPVESFWQVLIRSVENGIFLFKGMYKTFLPAAWKESFLGQHLLFLMVMTGAGAWWWQQRRRVSLAPLAVIIAASAFLYTAAAQVVLKLYAPDRYATYTIAVAGLLFIMIPVGMMASSWPGRRGDVLKAVVLLCVIACVPLIRGAGLTDYGKHQKLYALLGTLPKDALIAAWPDTADAIPVFAKRSVLVSAELSVPLFDAYWRTVTARTKDLLAAYYAADEEGVRSFARRYGVTHVVVERHRFTPQFLGGRVYFEPFGSWLRQRLAPGQGFYLEHAREYGCVPVDNDVCVLDVGGRTR